MHQRVTTHDAGVARALPARLPYLIGAAGLLLAGCSGGSPSTLNPKGPAAERIAGLWWFMFVVAAVVCVGIGVLILLGVGPFRRRPSGPPEGEPRWTRRMVFGGGVAFPAVVLTVLWVLTLHDINALSVPASEHQLTIEVVGHQWWWEVRYPAQGFTSANDLHIPAGQNVLLRLRTHDVLHSFWVPQITAKTDLISGRVNTMTLNATHTGVYRGQCAEFCGLQHAQMAFYVVVQRPASFQRWLGQHSKPPPAPVDPTLLRGQQVFLGSSCVACHAISGTTARARVGPDLSDFGERTSIGAGALANTSGNLGGWIINAQTVKPGNIMPPQQVGAADLHALIRYLESLK